MSTNMEVTPEALEQIGIYVKEHLGQWQSEQSGGSDATIKRQPDANALDVRERVVRIEDAVRHQSEITLRGFEAMDRRFQEQMAHSDRRFEAIDKRFEEQAAHFNQRFEAIDKRFDDTQRHSNRWMTVLTLVVALFGVLPILLQAM